MSSNKLAEVRILLPALEEDSVVSLVLRAFKTNSDKEVASSLLSETYLKNLRNSLEELLKAAAEEPHKPNKRVETLLSTLRLISWMQ